VAGSGKLPGGRAGLYLAFLLNEPWYGDELGADAAAYMRSAAPLVVVRRDSQIAAELKSHSWFHDLDLQLFDSPDAAAQFPLQVFQNISGSAAAP
jgi:hypothetical protein